MSPLFEEGQGLLFNEDSVFAVSEITARIKSLLDEEFSEVWVEGEVSNLKKPKSGHLYFTLKDEYAQLKCVMFQGRKKSMKFDLEDGMKVLCFGRISVYPQSGSYQLYVENVHAKGIGDLQLAFLQLKEKLEKEGLFEDARKREIPFMPSLIGVITSATGAAVRDIIKVARRRFPGVGILIYPVKVQGQGAAEEIANAIDEMNKAFFGEIDVLIVGRGGGSIEDLWAFNEEVVARAIFRSEIPVISAVGHEIDWTISDFVADKRAPTPSAAAEIAVPDKEKLDRRLTGLYLRLRSHASFTLENYKSRLKSAGMSRAFLEPKYIVQRHMQRLDEFLYRINEKMRTRREKTELQLRHLGVKLEMLSPIAVLNRGYVIVRKGRRVISSAGALRAGDNIELQFKDGGKKAKIISGREGKKERSAANEEERPLF